MRKVLGAAVGGAIGLGLAKLVVVWSGDTVATGLIAYAVVFLSAVMGMVIGGRRDARAYR